MSFTQSIELCFKKFSVFDGRARKSEFWWFQLFCIIAQIVGALLDYLFGYSETGAFEWVAYIIILLPISIYNRIKFKIMVLLVCVNR